MGSALTAVANRRFADERGGELVLRVDDTDASRNEAGAAEAILRDLEWLGVRWDVGPVRQSERGDVYRNAADRLAAEGRAAPEEGAIRFRAPGRPTLLRPDGRATYHLASVVDDAELGITHVIRGKDHLANARLHTELAQALGFAPPEYVHHGLLVGPDGKKLSKRHGAPSLAELRERGIPPEAVRAYLEELGLPRGDVHFDEARLLRLSVDVLGALAEEELAARAGVDTRLAPALRGARTLVEARALAELVERAPDPAASRSPGTLARFHELRALGDERLGPEEARELVQSVREAGGDLGALRLALTGASRGPELWAVVAALPKKEALRRASP